ncbi:hypothetical protein MMC17_001758 [Xylographa soralifera]|nr:hypothetical protein [Xylographa soralifera]
MPPPFAEPLARMVGFGPLIDTERQRKESIRAERILRSPHGQYSPFGHVAGPFDRYEDLFPLHQRATHDPPWFRRHLPPQRHQLPLRRILPQMYDDSIVGRRPRMFPRASLHHRVQPREDFRRRSSFRHRPDDRFHTTSGWDEDDAGSGTQYFDDMEPLEFSYDGDSDYDLQGSFERRRSRNESSGPFPRDHRGHRHHGIDDVEYAQHEGGMPRVYGRHPMDRHRTGLYRGSPYNSMDTGFTDEL